MITLICGLPGHGKSLFAVDRIAAEAFADNRPVFYHGIKDCRVPGWQQMDDPKEWPRLAPRSVVVIDEAHEVFPQRGPSSAVPPYVQAMAVHRGMGLDLVLITQDGNSIDHFARRRVGRYFHLWRAFGRQGAVVWEFPKWCDWEDYAARLQARKVHFPYRRESFALYKSAEVHTVKRSFPKKLLLLPLALVAVAFAAVFGYRTYFGDQAVARKIAEKQGVSTGFGLGVPSISGVIGGAKGATTAEYLHARVPRVFDMPESAPVFDSLAKPVVFPVVSGCVQSAKSCICYSQQGTRLGSVSVQFCAAFVKAGAFDPYSKPGGMGGRAPHAEPNARPTALVARSEAIAPSPPIPTLPSEVDLDPRPGRALRAQGRAAAGARP